MGKYFSDHSSNQKAKVALKQNKFKCALFAFCLYLDREKKQISSISQRKMKVGMENGKQNDIAVC